MKHRWIWLLAGLTGCAPEHADPPPPVVLNVFEGQSTPDAGIEDMITDLVAQKVPEVKLRWEQVGWGEQFQNQLRTLFAAGEVPDLIIGKAQDVATYLPSGNLAPLAPALTERVQPGVLGTVSQGNQVYGLPYNAFYQGVLYDKTLFRQLGLSVPTTAAQMAEVVRALEARGITPFASHFVENWYLGNIFMQFAIGEVLGNDARWGQSFRAGQKSFAGSAEMARCFNNVRFVFEHSWNDAVSIDQAEADQRFAQGRAAMYVTGTWSLQNIGAVKGHPELGLFPFPNERGDAKLIVEPNLTFMKGQGTEHGEAVDRVLAAILDSADLAGRIADFTQTASLLKVPVAAEPLPVQGDIDRYRHASQVVDASSGNDQLIWAFQSEVASRLQKWLAKKATLADVTAWSDRNRSLSAP
jgi:ABC-type glycerol-3-phosphate transport system substrate-binding protein